MVRPGRDRQDHGLQRYSGLLHIAEEFLYVSLALTHSGSTPAWNQVQGDLEKRDCPGLTLPAMRDTECPSKFIGTFCKFTGNQISPALLIQFPISF